MDTLAAAATLGVSPDASSTDVQRAFRRMARATHPDTNPSSTVDLDRLAEARDTLLAPAGDPTADGAAGTARTATAPTPPRGRSQVVRPAASGSSAGQGALRRLWAFIMAVGASVVVAAVVIAGVALATSDGDGHSGDQSTDCVLIGASGARPVPCTEAGAQHVVAKHSGARVCESGTNTLVVGATTWCLRPIE